jgi:hypothetical protein
MSIDIRHCFISAPHTSQPGCGTGGLAAGSVKWTGLVIVVFGVMASAPRFVFLQPTLWRRGKGFYEVLRNCTDVSRESQSQRLRAREDLDYILHRTGHVKPAGWTNEVIKEQSAPWTVSSWGTSYT